MPNPKEAEGVLPHSGGGLVPSIGIEADTSVLRKSTRSTITSQRPSASARAPEVGLQRVSRDTELYLRPVKTGSRFGSVILSWMFLGLDDGGRSHS